MQGYEYKYAWLCTAMQRYEEISRNMQTYAHLCTNTDLQKMHIYPQICKDMCPNMHRNMIMPTSGSPVSKLVCMRIFPRRMSLQTSATAGSIVSPARRIDTPHNYNNESVTISEYCSTTIEMPIRYLFLLILWITWLLIPYIHWRHPYACLYKLCPEVCQPELAAKWQE